jgi:dTDP-4-amino-4,6-dideoxygalactose transaminase
MSNKRPQRPLISVPDFARFSALVREVFDSGTLTNNGAKVQELEERLARFLGVQYLVLTSSGTLALQVAYRALGLTGEVITSPFSWVTTASSLSWLGLKPRFSDIDPRTFNIDPRGIETEIGPECSAILGVHTFGNPCNVADIDLIAERHGLRTVYDGAHAFGVRYRGKSILAYGDASILSLHATKMFHAVEGGAVILREADTYRRARLMVNNGLDPDGEVAEVGINGRMSELHAAVGLTLMDNIEGVLRRRRGVAEALRAQLAQHSAVELQQFTDGADVNHAYFPVVLPTPELREQLKDVLQAAGFSSRAYFATPLNQPPLTDDVRSMPVAESLSARVLCLSIAPEASLAEVRQMGDIVAKLCPAAARPRGYLQASR